MMLCNNGWTNEAYVINVVLVHLRFLPRKGMLRLEKSVALKYILNLRLSRAIAKGS